MSNREVPPRSDGCRAWGGGKLSLRSPREASRRGPALTLQRFPRKRVRAWVIRSRTRVGHSQQDSGAGSSGRWGFPERAPWCPPSPIEPPASSDSGGPAFPRTRSVGVTRTPGPDLRGPRHREDSSPQHADPALCSPQRNRPRSQREKGPRAGCFFHDSADELSRNIRLF